MLPSTACVRQETSSPSPFVYLHPSLKRVTEWIRKETDRLKGADQRVNRHKKKKKKKTYADKKRRATVGLYALARDHHKTRGECRG